MDIVAQPEWRTPDEFRRFGRPRLAFLVTAGNVDSMVNHFTAARHWRKTDVYSPGGIAGRRPDRAAYARSFLLQHGSYDAYASTVLIEPCEQHVSGQPKVAPEQVSRRVLDLMGKPGQPVFDAFVARFRQLNRELGKRQ